MLEEGESTQSWKDQLNELDTLIREVSNPVDEECEDLAIFEG